MNRHTETIGHLERSAGTTDSGERSPHALTAHARASVSSAQAAKWLGVSEVDLQYWRRGITAPSLNARKRLAGGLNLDVH
jgi:hypothetical protein